MAKVVFLDIDGVITDPEQLSIDFRTLPGEVLAPALGHTVADWGRAMGETYPAVFERHVIRGTVSDDPVAHFDEERRLSILAMCRCLGVDAPDDDEARRLGRAHNRHVRRHGDAPVADAAATIRKLATNGDVHLATGSMSWNALAVLDRIGVRELIGFPCGSDLVGVNKGFAAYYERLFAAVNVNPRDAIVADDSPRQLALASAIGASTVLVGLEQPEPVQATLAVSGIAEVPGAVAAIDAQR